MGIIIKKNSKGFSLIEVAAALVMLGIVLTGAINIFSHGLENVRTFQKRTIAYNLAREKLEEYSRIGISNGTYSEGYGAIADFADFRRQVVIADYLYPGQLQSITVTVYWESDNQSVTINTLKANY